MGNCEPPPRPPLLSESSFGGSPFKRVDPQTTAITAGTFISAMFVGTIAERTGNPPDTDQWEWNCGFYPDSEPGEITSGTAATFEEARTDFERAWRVFLSKRTETDFRAWRHQRDSTARKYALWDAGKKLPSNEWEPGKPCSRFRKCPCSAVFDTHGRGRSSGSRTHPRRDEFFIGAFPSAMMAFSRPFGQRALSAAHAGGIVVDSDVFRSIAYQCHPIRRKDRQGARACRSLKASHTKALRPTARLAGVQILSLRPNN